MNYVVSLSYEFWPLIPQILSKISANILTPIKRLNIRLKYAIQYMLM